MTPEHAAAQTLHGAATTPWWPLALVALLPAFGALINGLNGLLFRRRTGTGFTGTGFVNAVALGSVGLAFLITLWGFAKLLGMPAEARSLHADLWTWFDLGGARVNGGLATMTMKWGYKLDPLSVCMGLLVTGAGFLIHLFSTGYMADEQKDGRYWRFMTYLNLFVFSMLNLVLGSNMMMMFLGWEGVGLCSYLLIGFYFDKEFAAIAGKKAFVTNRIGDFGFVIGFALLFMLFGSVDFDTMMGMVRGVAGQGSLTILGHSASPTFWFNLAAGCLFLGACGKSAQIPLYVWLPDAMAGPTPVSALIHAATMVTSGLYMIARLNFIFVQAPLASDVVLFVGSLTALVAASMGTAQYDIKKVLAYSTVSQLGFMFMGMGALSYAAGMFHVFTHAFFKAALFLGSGSVIMACHHEQDMRNMGGLRKVMPKTYWSMLLATFAIAGIFPFSGFFSKDEILWKVFERWYHHGAYDGGAFYLMCWLFGVIGAGFTAFYMMRLIVMTFFGDYRGAGDDPHGLTVPSEAHHGDDHGHGAHGHGDDHAHAHASADHGHDGHSHGHGEDHGHHGPSEVPWNMWLPVAILAGLAVVGGFLNIPHSLHFLGGEHFSRFMEPLLYQAVAPHGGAHTPPAIEYALMVFANVWALGAMGLAWWMYKVDPSWSKPKAFVARFPGLFRWVNAKYYVDEFYEWAFIGPCKQLSAQLWAFDTWVVDGMVNGAARATVLWAQASYWFDANVVDGLVNLVAWVLQQASLAFKSLQSGRVHNYAFVMFLGFVAFAVWKLLV